MAKSFHESPITFLGQMFRITGWVDVHVLIRIVTLPTKYNILIYIPTPAPQLDEEFFQAH